MNTFSTGSRSGVAEIFKSKEASSGANTWTDDAVSGHAGRSLAVIKQAVLFELTHGGSDRGTGDWIGPGYLYLKIHRFAGFGNLGRVSYIQNHGHSGWWGEHMVALSMPPLTVFPLRDSSG